jgi:hypothetical protein
MYARRGSLALLDPRLTPVGLRGSYQALGANCFNAGGAPASQYTLGADLVVLRNPTTGELFVRPGPPTVTNDLLLNQATPNGRDQAAVFPASSWVHFYWVLTADRVLRSRSSLSAPPTGPTLSGEIAWAYAGAVRLDGAGALLATRIRGATAWYESGQNVLTNGGATGEEPVGVASFVPPNALSMVLAVTRLHARSLSAQADANVTLRYMTGQNFHSMAIQWIGTDAAAVGLSAGVPQVTMPNVGQQFFYLWGGPAVDIREFSVNVVGYVLPNGGG